MKRVLIADNEPAERQLLAASIAHTGVEVLVAANGHEAWSLLQTRRPELALLDINMPGRSGLELTRAIRADAGLKTTRVVLVSAHAGEDDVLAGRTAGADEYVTKPFSPRGLQNLVAELLAAV